MTPISQPRAVGKWDQDLVQDGPILRPKGKMTLQGMAQDMVMAFDDSYPDLKTASLFIHSPEQQTRLSSFFDQALRSAFMEESYTMASSTEAATLEARFLIIRGVETDQDSLSQAGVKTIKNTLDSFFILQIGASGKPQPFYIDRRNQPLTSDICCTSKVPVNMYINPPYQYND